MAAFPPVYVGNYEYDASEKELEHTFDKFGRVERVEYKSGFCFVHYEEKRDAEDCIAELDGREWGRMRRRLRVEFAKNDANVREYEKKRRDTAAPNKTLFVAGFDPRNIRTRDIEKSFEAFGRLRRCEIKKTFAFIEFEEIEDAKAACNELHGTRISGREVTVEYVKNKGGWAAGEGSDRGGDRGGGGFGGGGGYGGGGGGFRDRFDDRGGGGRGGYDDRGRGRSRSGERRRRSPSYGRGRSRSPPPARRRSPSPPPRRRSPSPRGRSRSPPPRRRSPSPPPHRRSPSPRRRSRSPPPRRRSVSPAPRRSVSPAPRERSPSRSPSRGASE